MTDPLLDPLPEDWDRASRSSPIPTTWSTAPRWPSPAGPPRASPWPTRWSRAAKPASTRSRPREAGPLREEEQRQACAAVGVDALEFLGHRDGVIEAGLDLRRDLARAIRWHRPELILSINFRLTFGPSAFNMADHRVVGEAALDAARDAGNRWIFPELLDEGLEPWSGVRMVAFSGSPQPSHAVDVTGYLDRGIASLGSHRTYLENLGGDFDPAAFLTSIAAGSGPTLGVEHAVTFEVLDL